MNHFNTRIGLAISSLALIVLVSSCEQPRPPGANVPASNVAANTAPAVNSQPQSPPSAGASLPVTMPLLDAMFADESFGAEAKNQLQLSDEELSKVRDAARNSVLELGSGGGNNASHLKQHFDMVLVDLSAGMSAVSRKLTGVLPKVTDMPS